VPCKVLYLKGVVTKEDLADEAGYQEVCTDIRLEAEKFGPVVSMEVPRPRAATAGGGTGGNLAITGGQGPLALTNASAEEPGQSKAKSAPSAPADLSLALVPVGGQISKAPLPTVGAPTGGGFDGSDTPGLGYAFIEFATIEGSSKAKKALNGRRFGPNLVDAEYFSEDKYHARDFARPTPNVDEPRREVGMELALVGDGAGLEEAPVMVE